MVWELGLEELSAPSRPYYHTGYILNINTVISRCGIYNKYIAHALVRGPAQLGMSALSTLARLRVIAPPIANSVLAASAARHLSFS